MDKDEVNEREFNTCSVANQFCEIPANVEPNDGFRSLKRECRRCGNHVCKTCSDKRTYLSKRVILCDNCQEDIDGDDERLMKKLYRLAGRESEYNELHS